MAQRKTQFPSECRKCPRWSEIRERFRISKILAKAADAFQKRLESEKDLKPTIGDFLKLVQLEKEVGQDEAKEIRIKWVNPTEESKSEQ